MVKCKFGASVRAKSFPAQINEVLLKCLCHNLSVLVHAIHELGERALVLIADGGGVAMPVPVAISSRPSKTTSARSGACCA